METRKFAILSALPDMKTGNGKGVGGREKLRDEKFLLKNRKSSCEFKFSLLPLQAQGKNLRRAVIPD